jgi:predicted TIM-barrel fold metal-dependent hydrolase
LSNPYQAVFPLHPDHPYRPKKADLDDLLVFESKNNIEHVCIVSMSVYGTDNRSLLDALKRLNGKGRGVVCIDPETITDEELEDMHSLGVRGVRLNLFTWSQKLDKTTFIETLRKYADRIHPFGWVLQLYISLDQIQLVASEIPALGIPVVIDHLGAPAADKPPRKQAGYAEFMSLLKRRQVWVKLSGTYRFAGLPELEQYAQEIIRLAPSQIVWASDWPHSGGVQHNPGGDRHISQEYRKISIPEFIETCKRWCNYDEDTIQKIWVENPRRLWQYDE